MGALTLTLVMPGLVPGIHDWASCTAEIVDGRDKPGHDEKCGIRRRGRVGNGLPLPTAERHGGHGA